LTKKAVWLAPRMQGRMPGGFFFEYILSFFTIFLEKLPYTDTNKGKSWVNFYNEIIAL